MSAAQNAQEATESLEYPYNLSGEQRKQTVKEYFEETRRIEMQFRLDLIEAEGLGIEELDSLIYDKAWDQSHDAGYEAVEDSYRELVDFVAEVRKVK